MEDAHQRRLIEHVSHSQERSWRVCSRVEKMKIVIVPKISGKPPRASATAQTPEREVLPGKQESAWPAIT